MGPHPPLALPAPVSSRRPAMSPIIVLMALFSLGYAAVIPNAVFTNYHSQDELGGYDFGYSGGPSSRAEKRDHLGIVRGAYNLVDSNGNVQRYQYIADAAGYRLVSGTHLPVQVLPVVVEPAPVAPTVTLVAPEPVQETPEVQKARAEFEVLFKKAAAAKSATTTTA